MRTEGQVAVRIGVGEFSVRHYVVVVEWVKRASWEWICFLKGLHE